MTIENVYKHKDFFPLRYCFNKLQVFVEYQWLLITVEERLKSWPWPIKFYALWLWPAFCGPISSCSHLCSRWPQCCTFSVADSSGIWMFFTLEIFSAFCLFNFLILFTSLLGSNPTWDMFSNHLIWNATMLHVYPFRFWSPYFCPQIHS